MRIRHISFSSQGGAGKAAARLADLQSTYGLDSQHIFVSDSDLRTRPFRNPVTTLLAAFDFFVMQKGETRNGLFSGLRASLEKDISELNGVDIFHLHWPSGVWGSRNFYSARMKNIRVVQTLHDDFPFTGGCHNSGNCIQYSTGCQQCPMVHGVFKWAPSAELAKKVRIHQDVRPIITAQSQWMLNRALSSMAFGSAEAHKIHNVLPKIFTEHQPSFQIDRQANFKNLKVGFIAANVHDPNKGFDSAVRILRESGLDFTLRVVGRQTDKRIHSSGTINFLGTLKSDDLATESASWDFLFVNSIHENAPTIISEMACLGVPTLAVDVGAVSELIESYGYGETIPPNASSLEFSRAAMNLVHSTTTESRARLSMNARHLHSRSLLHEAYLRSYGVEM